MAARRDRLARARKAAGYTQERLAEELHIDRTAVHTWESGKHEPLPYLRPKLARLLGLTLRELETLLANETSNSTDEHWAALIRTWVDTMNRRELLQLLGWTTATASAPSLTNLNTDEQERVAKAVAAPQRVDEQVIGHIETIYWTCRRQDDALGAQAVLATVLAQIALTETMLPHCPGHLRPKLLATYSKLSDLAGWLHTDSGNYSDSNRHREQARLSAHETRDPTLASFILSRMSYTARAEKKLHLAIDYAEAAQKLAGRGDDALVQGYASSQTARSYAEDGQLAPCMEALDETEQALEIATSQSSAPVSLAYFYDEGSIGSAKSSCFLALDRPHDAVAQAHNSLSRHEKAMVRDNAYTMLYLANAHIQLKEPDAAALIMGDVIEATTQNRSVRLRERLHSTRATLRPWNDSDAVRQLDERLAGSRG
ncbi:helix-turn-helix transcriptional regulator [Actinokineospora iranica]|uniref:DNA-binding transcriptional regulator, XRE-family HTH domain n=1 Tax=Actinokineospora iranica TaxID=1271860 RepID=A0A1G6Q7S7_9PSEU|nr:helix-turn-helix transcriptional regulator [Actinokineospora iranica]SDC87756.1 DNA-binding transcriptional regulator, XRE-family HTH domain [Actinokineospora iranica]